jgi:hypothetical protein
VGSSGALIDVTSTRGRRRSGVRLHRVRALSFAERGRLDGIPVTSLPRTLLDLAEVLDAQRLERALEQAERLRLLDVAALEATIRAARGRRGVRPLRAALSRHAPTCEARSELERRFLDLCCRAGLPRPALNAWVAGCEVDAVWAAARVVVELDGYEFHRTRAAFERDRARDAALLLAGYRVLRVTWRRLVDAPEEIAGALALLLAGNGRGENPQSAGSARGGRSASG